MHRSELDLTSLRSVSECGVYSKALCEHAKAGGGGDSEEGVEHTVLVSELYALALSRNRGKFLQKAPN